MFENGELMRCQQRKAALLQQSAARRRELATNAQTLRAAAEWVDVGIGVVRKARAGLVPLRPLWQMRKQGPSGLARKLAGAMAFIRSLTAVWKRWY